MTPVADARPRTAWTAVRLRGAAIPAGHPVEKDGTSPTGRGVTGAKAHTYQTEWPRRMPGGGEATLVIDRQGCVVREDDFSRSRERRTFWQAHRREASESATGLKCGQTRRAAALRPEPPAPSPGRTFPHHADARVRSSLGKAK
jgi:hypothetical protein